MLWEALRPSAGFFVLVGVLWLLLRFEPWRLLVPLWRSWREHG